MLRALTAFVHRREGSANDCQLLLRSERNRGNPMKHIRDGRKVTFLGGPFDGRREVFAAPLAAFLGVNSTPPRRWWNRLWSPWSGRPDERMAVYELELRTGRFVYCYLQTLLELSSTHGKWQFRRLSDQAGESKKLRPQRP